MSENLHKMKNTCKPHGYSAVRYVQPLATPTPLRRETKAQYAAPNVKDNHLTSAFHSSMIAPCSLPTVSGYSIPSCYVRDILDVLVILNALRRGTRSYHSLYRPSLSYRHRTHPATRSKTRLAATKSICALWLLGGRGGPRYRQMDWYVNRMRAENRNQHRNRIDPFKWTPARQQGPFLVRTAVCQSIRG